MAKKSESATDKLVKKKRKGYTNSSQSEVVHFSNPSGTFPSGVEILQQKDFVILAQPATKTSNVTQKARAFLKTYRNKTQVKQTIELLEAIEYLLTWHDDLSLPEIKISRGKDRSLVLSWRVKDAFFGAAIRPDISESSWFLMQGDIEKGYKADGNLDAFDYETQLPTAVDLLIKTHNKQRGKDEITS